MKARTKLALVATLAIGLNGMVGCEWAQRQGIQNGAKVPYNPDEGRERLAAQRDIQFNDIPVPRGFTLTANNVFSFQAASFRFGEFVYEGTWTFRRAASFYQDQMPVDGWELKEIRPVNDYKATLVYEKGPESCLIDIQSDMDAVRIKISLDKIQKKTDISAMR